MHWFSYFPPYRGDGSGGASEVSIAYAFGDCPGRVSNCEIHSGTTLEEDGSPRATSAAIGVFLWGMYSDEPQKLSFSRNKTFSGWAMEILMSNCKFDISSNTMSASTNAFQLIYPTMGDFGLIEGNSVTMVDGEMGMFALGLSGAVVKNNQFKGGMFAGAFLSESSGNTFIGNSFSKPVITYYLDESASGNTVKGSSGQFSLDLGSGNKLTGTSRMKDAGGVGPKVSRAVRDARDTRASYEKSRERKWLMRFRK
jgi:parallel beta-helix repeat protein